MKGREVNCGEDVKGTYLSVVKWNEEKIMVKCGCISSCITYFITVSV
jgi:hypothetical protein